MSKHVIVYNNATCNEEQASTYLSMLASLMQLHDHSVTVSYASAQGWLGQRLKQLPDSATEVFIIPVAFNSFDKLTTLKNFANTNGFGLVTPSLELPVSNHKFALKTDFILYADLTKLGEQQRANLDFGSVCKLDAIHLVNFGLNDSGCYTKLEPTVMQQYLDIEFGSGWILTKLFIDSQSSVALAPIEYSFKQDSFANGITADLITAMLTGVYSDNIGLTQSQFEVVHACVDSKSAADDLVDVEFTSRVSTNFNSPITPLENFYASADLNNLKLLKNYQLTEDSRCVFFGKSEELELVRTTLELWNGFNSAELNHLTSQQQQTLDAVRTAFNDDSTLADTLALVRRNYKQWFTLDNFALLEDLESQCHVNNVFAVPAAFNEILIKRISQLRLYSTELLYTNSQGQHATVKIGPNVYQHRLYKTFRITFRNTQTGETLPVDHKIADFFTAQKWARCMQFDYLEAENNVVEKNYMMQQWEYDESNPNARSIPVLCAEMNRYVQVINAYFDGSSDRRVNYHITQYFDPATLDQQILNEIHHHFEVLIGQVWSVSEYYKKANPPTTFAIRQLNNLCHEMEYLRRPSLRNVTDERTPWQSGIYFPWIPTIRYKFVECDYDHFTQIVEYGDIILHYAQLGKTPMEAYYARDEEVFDNNITGLRYLSGEFDVVYKQDVPRAVAEAHFARANVPAFEWIRARGQDPESKFTGIGFVPVAKIDRSQWPGLNARQIHLELFKYDDVYKLELLDATGNVLAERTLDYTWRDVLKWTDPTHPEFTGLISWQQL